MTYKYFWLKDLEMIHLDLFFGWVGVGIKLLGRLVLGNDPLSKSWKVGKVGRSVENPPQHFLSAEKHLPRQPVT